MKALVQEEVTSALKKSRPPTNNATGPLPRIPRGPNPKQQTVATGSTNINRYYKQEELSPFSVRRGWVERGQWVEPAN